MKQKLFLLSLLVACVTNVLAWTEGTDNDSQWWKDNNYSGTDQAENQIGVKSSWEIPIPGTSSVNSNWSDDVLYLDWAKYDLNKNAIKELLNSSKETLPEETQKALQAIYDGAVIYEKRVNKDWHSTVFASSYPTIHHSQYVNMGSYYYYLAYHYTDIKTSWDAAIDKKADELNVQYQVAKSLVAAVAAKAQYDEVAADVKNLYGKEKGLAPYPSLVQAATDLADLISDNESLAGATTGKATTIAQKAADLEEYLKQNEEKKADYDAIFKNYKDVLAEANAIIAEDQLNDPYKANLQNAIAAAQAALASAVTAAEDKAYNKVEGTEGQGINLATETAKLQAAINDAVLGTSKPSAILQKDWTYNQPLPIGDTSAGYILDWDAYDNAREALDAISSTDIANLGPAAKEVAQAYKAKKEQVVLEWADDAFDPTFTTYTKANQWKYNQTVWQRSIDADVAAIKRAISIANVLKNFGAQYTALNNFSADKVFAGDYATEYGKAKTEGEAYANMAQAQLVALLNNAGVDDVVTINNVRAYINGTVNALTEEGIDAQTAGEFLKLVIDQATIAKNQMDGTANAQKEAKADLEAAITTAQGVLTLVQTPDYKTFESSKDIVAAANVLATALSNAKYKYDGVSSPVGVPIDYSGTDNKWVYATPEHLGTTKLPTAAGKEAYTLDWTEYKAAQEALAAFAATNATDLQNAATALSDAFEAKEAKAENQWTTQQAWSDESTAGYPTPGAGYPFATNWSYNQDSWQSGINADVVTMKQALRVANALAGLKKVIDVATDPNLKAQNIVGDFKTPIQNALTKANDLYTANKALPSTSIEEAVLDQVLAATAQLQNALAANNEEIQDVLTAANLLKANIYAAQALIDKNMVADADKPGLQAQIDAAQAVLDKVAPADPANADFSTVNNAADVTATYMALLNYVSDTKTGDSHKPTTASYDWTYSLPLSLGEESAAGLDLDWTRYDAAVARLSAAQAAAADVQDATFRGITNKILAGYAGKKNRAMADWETKAAWDGATAYAKNWSYNQETWNAQIDADAAKIEQFVSFVESANALYNLIGDDNNNAKKLSASTEILGAYKTSLDAAITLGENVYNQLVTSNVNYADAGHTGSSYDVLKGEVTAEAISNLNVATAQLQSVIGANIEETEDVMAAAEVLKHAITAAMAAADNVEDIEGGVEFKKAIQDLVNDAPNYQKLYDNAKASNFTEATFEVANSETLIAAANKLKEDVNTTVGQYLHGITNVTPVAGEEWVYATPIRVGDNQDPAPREVDGLGNPKLDADGLPYTKYLLDWTAYDEQKDILTAKTSDDTNLKDVINNLATTIQQSEDKAKVQWANTPAWEGTNQKYVNQFQYNQTMWQEGIKQSVAKIKDGIAMIDAMNALYDVKEAGTKQLAANNMPQANDIKKYLTDALAEANTLYADILTTAKFDAAALQDVQVATQKVNDALELVKEETKDIKTAQALLKDALNAADAAKETVEDVDGGITYKTNIQEAINKAQKFWDQSNANDFLSSADPTYAIKFAKTLTDAIRDLNKAVRDNIIQYRASIDNVAPATGWVYAQPLRIGKEKDPAVRDGEGKTAYTLKWDEFDKAIANLVAVQATLQDAAFKDGIFAETLAYYQNKKTTAEDQWINKEGWVGINDKYINQYQHNETTWNQGIQNDAEKIEKFAAMAQALNALYLAKEEAKAKYIPAADNKNVVASYATAMQQYYDAADAAYTKYVEYKDVTLYDIQVVKSATSMLNAIIAGNLDERERIDNLRPLLWTTVNKEAKDALAKIKDDVRIATGAYMEPYNDLKKAIDDATVVFQNANNHLYNKFNDAIEISQARRDLIFAMIKQTGLYQDSVRLVKDSLQIIINNADSTVLVVNKLNTITTELQSEIAHAEAMIAKTANTDITTPELYAEIKKLQRIYCTAFLLDLDSLKAAIADAQKFYDGTAEYSTYPGIEAAREEVKNAIGDAQTFLSDAEGKNASQFSTAEPYDPFFTDFKTFNTYNTVDVPAATDKLNKAHMAQNLAALKAASDTITNYLNDQPVVALYAQSLQASILEASQAINKYEPLKENKDVFSNFSEQDKITDAIVTTIHHLNEFSAKNEQAIAEAEAVRTKLTTKIADATTLKGELTDAASQNNLQTAIETAQGLVNDKNASPEAMTNGVTALDLAMKTARWTDDIARLSAAILDKEQEAQKLVDVDAQDIMAMFINKAQSMLNKLQASVYTEITTTQVTDMIAELADGLKRAQTYNNGEMLPDLIAKAAPYESLIKTEYDAAVSANDNAATLSYDAVKAAGDALAEATAKAKAYTDAKNQLQTSIDEAKLAEEQSADYKQAVEDAETAVAAAFTQNQTDLTNIINKMEGAYNTLKSLMDNDRWSHQALGGKMIVQPWFSNDPKAGQRQYIKLAGKYTTVDADVANNAVDLFLTNVQGTAGTRTFDWLPFSVESNYKASGVNLTSQGVADLNNFKKYGWSYDEHYNDIIIRAGAIYSSGDGFVDSNLATYGPYTWTNVWNQNDIDILDKDADGLYYGRYYTFKWSETNEGGVYRVPTTLQIYDDSNDDFKVDDIQTYISQPNQDGTYFINSDITLARDKGYDDQGTTFNYENGTAVLTGRWHRVQFIDENQYLFHKAAQEAADWFNNNPDLRHYSTKALAELRQAVETKDNRWEFNTKRIEEALKKAKDSYDKVNMLIGDSIYGVIAAGDNADVQHTYTVTGAPGDAIDAKIIAQTKDWTKDDAQYWEIISNGNIIGNDSTATITVKFNPGNNYPADYREYQAILDVKVGNLNYQDEGKDSLQQNLYGSNPILSLKENELLQAHSLNLHRKDSITYDLYGRGFAWNYEKTKLTANYFSKTGMLLETSEATATFAKKEFTCYAKDNDLDQTKVTIGFYPVDLGDDVYKVVLTDSINDTDDIVFTVNVCKSQITFDPATVTDANQNKIQLDKMADGTDSYFFPADGETYFFPIAISNFDGVNANTKVVNEDGVISITTEVTDPTTGLVVEHERHDVQITIDNREYFTVETATTQINGTSKNIFVIAVKTDKLEQGTLDDGQHDGLLQIIWQDQDTINIHLNQTLPWFSAPTTAAPGAGPIVDSVDGNIEWEFTEDGDKIWYVDVNDVDNYYNYAMNFGAYTNTDWFIVDPAISYQLTPQRGTRKYRLKITYNPHEVNTVYTDVLTLNIFDTKRNVIVATTSINLKGDAVSSIKGGATGVNNAEVDNSKKDGKYFKNGKIVIVKGDQEFDASGAQTK